MSVTRNITNGPSKYDLQMSFFNPQLKLRLEFISQNRLRVKDKISLNTTHRLFVNQLQVEDGSGDRFNFLGLHHQTGQKYEGYYSTKDRKGWIKEL